MTSHATLAIASDQSPHRRPREEGRIEAVVPRLKRASGGDLQVSVWKSEKANDVDFSGSSILGRGSTTSKRLGLSSTVLLSSTATTASATEPSLSLASSSFVAKSEIEVEHPDKGSDDENLEPPSHNRSTSFGESKPSASPGASWSGRNLLTPTLIGQLSRHSSSRNLSPSIDALKEQVKQLQEINRDEKRTRRTTPEAIPMAESRRRNTRLQTAPVVAPPAPPQSTTSPVLSPPLLRRRHISKRFSDRQLLRQTSISPQSSEYRHKVNQQFLPTLMSELEHTYGPQHFVLQVNEMGTCVIPHPRTDFCTVLEVPPVGCCFFLYSLVWRDRKLSSPRMMQRALELNYLGQETGGAILSLDPSCDVESDGMQYTLSFAHPFPGMSDSEFVLIVTNFMQTTASVHFKLKKTAEEEELKATIEMTTESDDIDNASIRNDDESTILRGTAGKTDRSFHH